MIKIFTCVLLVTILSFRSKAQGPDWVFNNAKFSYYDTAEMTKWAKHLTLLEVDRKDCFKLMENSTVYIDTFSRFDGTFKDMYGYWMFLIKVKSEQCEFIIAYELKPDVNGKMYRLKGFSAYNSKDVREILKVLNFKNAPEGSLVHELRHLKYCKSNFRQFLFYNRIPKSCASQYPDKRIIRY